MLASVKGQTRRLRHAVESRRRELAKGENGLLSHYEWLQVVGNILDDLDGELGTHVLDCERMLAEFENNHPTPTHRIRNRHRRAG